jgi:hypothetical protein
MEVMYHKCEDNSTVVEAGRYWVTYCKICLEDLKFEEKE